MLAVSPKAQRTPLLAAWSNCQSVNLRFSPEQGCFFLFLFSAQDLALCPFASMAYSPGFWSTSGSLWGFPTYSLWVYRMVFLQLRFNFRQLLFAETCTGAACTNGQHCCVHEQPLQRKFSPPLTALTLLFSAKSQTPEVPRGLLLGKWSLCTNC